MKLKSALFAFALSFLLLLGAIVNRHRQTIVPKHQPMNFSFAMGGKVMTPTYKKPKLHKSEKWVVHLRLNGEVNVFSRQQLVTEIDQVNIDGADSIVLEINTPGGIVPEGFEITRAIESSPIPVYCVVDGEAASMGLYILEGCKTRLMTKRSLLMGHQPAMGINGQPDEIQKTRSKLEMISDVMAEHIALRMKITATEYKAKIAHGQEWWMEWDEAKKVAAIDDVVSSVEATIDALKHNKPLPVIQ